MRATYIWILFYVTFNKRVAAQNTSCGTLDFYAASGTISSPNYPGLYTDNLNCNYTITVGSPSNSVSITFQDLNTEACCDWVQVFCEDGSFQSSRFNGTSIPPAIMVSSCSRILVWFRSDGSVVRTGFSLSYANCGNTAFAGESGAITSPNYPSYYYSNVACNYTIVVTNAQPYAVVLTFPSFDIGNDFVQIYCASGQSFNSPKYSNYVQPQVLTVSSCNRVVVIFTTPTLYYLKTGFRINYEVQTKAITGGFLTKPLNVFAPMDSFYSAIFNCTSNSGYTPSWSFTSHGFGNISLTTPLCAVSVYSGYNSWFKTEAAGPGDCNLIISAPAGQLQNLAGVYICTDSTLTSSTAVFVPYNLAFSSTSVSGSQTLPSVDFLRGDQLNITCKLEVCAYYYTPLTPGIFLYHLVYGTSFYKLSVLGNNWYSDGESVLPSIRTSNTSSYTIVTAPPEALLSYTCNFSVSLLTNLTSAASNYPDVFSKSTYIKVKYWPVEENMKITGDTNGAISINGTLTCYVPANPQATYIWFDVSNGNYINGPTINVSRSGNYTCNASNVIRRQVYQASRSITVQTISSHDVQSTQEGLNLLHVIIGVSAAAGVLLILLLSVIVIACVLANRKEKIKTNENENGERKNATNCYDVTRRQRTSDRNVDLSSFYSNSSYEDPYVAEINCQPNVHSIYANV